MQEWISGGLTELKGCRGTESIILSSEDVDSSSGEEEVAKLQMLQYKKKCKYSRCVCVVNETC